MVREAVMSLSSKLWEFSPSLMPSLKPSPLALEEEEDDDDDALRSLSSFIMLTKKGVISPPFASIKPAAIDIVRGKHLVSVTTSSASRYSSESVSR
jgi:hypothetical protein